MPQLRAGLGQVRASNRSELTLKECVPPQLQASLHSIRVVGLSIVISVTSAEAAHWVRLRRYEIERAIADKGLKFNELLVNVQSKTGRVYLTRPLPNSNIAKKIKETAAKTTSKHLQTSLEKLAATLNNAEKS